MRRFRQSRLRTRLSLLVIVALAWTQFALASHPACTLASMVLSGGHAVQAGAGDPAPEPCHPEAPAGSDALAECQSHCSRSELAPEASRVLSVPDLAPPLPAPPVLTLEPPPGHPIRTPAAGRPMSSWHRPTDHPASLLLI
jgi:hypothetical protein